MKFTEMKLFRLMPILLWLSSVFVGFAELVNNWSSSEERSFLISVGYLVSVRKLIGSQFGL